MGLKLNTHTSYKPKKLKNMEPKIANGAAGGTHVIGSPLTSALTRETAPDLLVNDIDSRIVKVRPMATPVDQISRIGTPRKCKSMIAEYYSVDTVPTMTTVSKEFKTAPGKNTCSLHVVNPAIFSATETVYIPGLSIGEEKLDGVFYVSSVENETITIRSIGRDEEMTKIPDIPMGAKVIRMGRAAAELDVQTTQAQAIPVKHKNFCQIFKAQVELGNMQRVAAKEVGWTLSDQEELAVIDMRQGMEKSFLFGKGYRFDKGAGYGEVFMTEGIWHQTNNDFRYTKGRLTPQSLVSLSRMAFTGCGSSSRKVLIAGSGLIEALSSMETVKMVGATQTVTRWGIDFTEIHTKFGRLYVVLSETFDACDHPDDGMIIDPEYLQKYVHIPFRTLPIDLSKSGQRNTRATVLTEASCLVLRYPTAHVRIIAESDEPTTPDTPALPVEPEEPDTPGGDDFEGE